MPRYGPRRGYTPYLLGAARSVARDAYRWAGNQRLRDAASVGVGAGAAMLRGRRSNVRAGQGVTNQFDVKTIYRRRTAPGRVRRRGKRFSSFRKKVKAALCRELGSRTVVFNKSISVNQSSPTTLNGMWTGAVYGACSSNSELNDLYNICTSENLNSGAQKTGKMIFTGAVLDLTLQNTSSAGGVGNIGTLEIDVYEITARKKFVNPAGTGLQQLEAVFDQGQANCLAVGGAPLASLLTIEAIGVSPWDIPQALSEYGLKIWSKKKYLLSGGQCMTYQLRDHKKRTLDRQDLLDSSVSGCNLPGWTRFVYIMFKLVPNDRTAGTAVAGIQVGCTRKYIYKKLEQEGDFGSTATL